MSNANKLQNLDLIEDLLKDSLVSASDLLRIVADSMDECMSRSLDDGRLLQAETFRDVAHSIERDARRLVKMGF